MSYAPLQQGEPMRIALASLLCVFLQTSLFADDFQTLFNGKDLTGWKGLPDHWSVQNGKIVGTSVGKPIKGNTFLIWQDGQLEDFELVVEMRAEGNNSGIQYRSEVVDLDYFVMKGYQCDVHPSPEYLGMLYAEKWRGILATRGQSGTLPAEGKIKVSKELPKTPEFKADEFNTVRVVAVGNHLIHQINGVTTVDVIDEHPEAMLKGKLGLQLHAGPPMTVEVKSVKYRPLKKDEGTKLIDQISKGEQKSAAKSSSKRIKPSEFVVSNPKPNWIWAKKDADRVQFRKELELPSKPVSTQLFLSCDNVMTLYVNGKKVAEEDNWEQPVNKNLVSGLKAGKNVIAIDAENRGGSAGLLLKLAVKMEDGKTVTLVTDRSWKQSTELSDAFKGDVSGDWGQPSREQGLVGMAPWGVPGSRESDGPIYADKVNSQPGFVVERIYDVPLDEEGSWVALCPDGKNGLIASDQQNKGMYHITFGENSEVNVEKIDLDISGAQGLLMYKGDLYFDRQPTGLHRAYDSNGDGKFDKIEKLPSASGSGEHGTHAIIEDGEGDGFFLVAGNHSHLPPDVTRYRVKAYAEDELFPRNWDPRGHARGIQVPGGFITKFHLDDKTHELYSMGFRNTYDIGLNRFGDLFAYDADMEWDVGMPWYRPTRILHATSGADFGWRSGSHKSPEYHEDTLPAILDIGPGSPTGVVSGAGLKFPTKYQDALYALDWTFGTIYAIHLEPSGSSYKATLEPLVDAKPLPVTDAAVGGDGNLYFATGGRGLTSALYRVKYVGKESLDAPSTTMSAEAKKMRDQRRSLEEFHGIENPAAVDHAWPFLTSDDRPLRYAARLAIEAQPVEQWASKLSSESRSQAQITGAIALARVGGKEHQSMVYQTLLKANPKKLDVMQMLGLLRAYDIAFCRLGTPDTKTKEAIIAQVEPCLDDIDSDARIQAEAIKLMVALNAPGVVQKGVAILTERKRPEQATWAVRLENNDHYGSTIQEMLKNPPDLLGLRLAYYLKNQKTGWTMSQRRDFLTFLNSQGKVSGGASYPGYLKLIRDDFLGNATNEERAALADLSGETFQPQPDFEITPPKGPGREWKVEDASRVALKDANFENGRNLYFATTCGKCHRFAGLGGDIGPDLTTISNKFDQKYLVESIIDPSKVISDQYQSTTVVLSNGLQYSGLVVESDGKVVIYPSDVNAKEVVVTPDEIELKEPSPVSQMPEKLINTLSPEEVRDLVAYLMSAGDPNAAYYKKK